MAIISGSSTQAADSSANLKSDVWNYFTKDKDHQKAKCQLCSKDLAFHSCTTYLRDHLLNWHSGTYKGDGGRKEKQGTLLHTFARPKHCFEARAKEITDRIASFVAQDMRPVGVVEGQGFIKLMAYLEPGYKMPSRKHITAIIRQKHDLGTKSFKRS